MYFENDEVEMMTEGSTTGIEGPGKVSGQEGNNIAIRTKKGNLERKSGKKGKKFSKSQVKREAHKGQIMEDNLDERRSKKYMVGEVSLMRRRAKDEEGLKGLARKEQVEQSDESKEDGVENSRSLF